MWEMRRDPTSLSDAERAKLEKLFTQIPELRTLYHLRVRFKAIFDTATDQRQAARQLMELYVDATDAFPELESFFRTYERWQEQILNYFASGQTSGVVEGLNNKARVVTKRAYGLKSAETLWTRLILDVNLAGNMVLQTVASIRELVRGFRAIFSPLRT
jgi:transposase